jgi:hypothetical protein
MYLFLYVVSSVSAATAAIIRPPMPAITTPAILPRQASDNGNFTVGYVALGSHGGSTTCKHRNPELHYSIISNHDVGTTSQWEATASYLYTYDTFYQQCLVSTIFETDGTTTTSLLPTNGCSVWTDCSHTTVYNAAGSSTW